MGRITRSGNIPQAGITLGLVSEKKGGPKSIERITLTSPSPLATSKGIRIGSTEAEVNKAYGRFRNVEDEQAFGGFVVGSVFGGVMFNFDAGQGEPDIHRRRRRIILAENVMLGCPYQPNPTGLKRHCEYNGSTTKLGRESGATS